MIIGRRALGAATLAVGGGAVVRRDVAAQASGSPAATWMGAAPVRFEGGYDSVIGRLDMPLGFPTPQTSVLLQEALDVQRATQAYLWALPLTGFAQWQAEHERAFGARDGDLVSFESFTDKLGLLTANATTPYIIGFANLDRTGPLVMDVPAGPTAGGFLDFWQRPVSDIGQTGPDAGRGGRFVILGPSHRQVPAEGRYVVRSPTTNVFIGTRILLTGAAEIAALRSAFRVYPLAQAASPPDSIRYIRPDGRPWSGTQPRGLAYWALLAKMVNEEPAHERDRLILAGLVRLGIEKGRPFAPDVGQRRILEQASVVGEAMARVKGYDARPPGAEIWPSRRWHYALNFAPDQRFQNHDALDERAAYFYEAVTVSHGMTVRQAGPGQVYLGTAKDKHGDFLDGGRNYRLRVPKDAPAEQFWSITAYDNDTRCFIPVPQQRADRSSRDDIALNADGSADIFFGPAPPAGREQNWVPTLPGRSWFALFRLYAPKAAFFDRSWVLSDMESA
ncbi:DUF1254 domain-containing protein [Falsiroseomonas sp. E2-1-a20]|uniref:DUF1254 domain-containing protein n=1 Tax=Falsiroseomonas sp. E2-1-a20 TaxID=3239300 RepID=UPI003F2D633F